MTTRDDSIPEIATEKVKPEEKVLSEKLMEELKVPDKPVTETKPGWHLPKFPFRRAMESPPAMPELVEPVATQLTAEALLKMIDEKSLKISGDEFLSIKINKQWSLILIGLILIMMWALPFLQRDAKKSTELVNEVSNQIKETPIEPRIRVRLQTNTLEAMEVVKKMLNEAGYTQIDFMYDPQIDADTVLVVTLNQNSELNQRLVGVFSDMYRMASESAELTSDSNFDASVLIGEKSKI